MSGPNTKHIKREICNRLNLRAKQVSVRRGRGTASGCVKVRVNADRQVVMDVEDFLKENADDFGFYLWTSDWGTESLQLSVSDWEDRQFLNYTPHPVIEATKIDWIKFGF